MSPKKRTIAILKYIDSIEMNRSKYVTSSYNNSLCNIYFIYKEVVKELSPGHYILKNIAGPIKIHLLSQEDTNYVLPRKYRMLINLISHYYHQKNRKFLLPLIRAITERSRILFSK